MQFVLVVCFGMCVCLFVCLLQNTIFYSAHWHLIAHNIMPRCTAQNGKQSQIHTHAQSLTHTVSYHVTLQISITAALVMHIVFYAALNQGKLGCQPPNRLVFHKHVHILMTHRATACTAVNSCSVSPNRGWAGIYQVGPLNRMERNNTGAMWLQRVKRRRVIDICNSQ